MHRNHQPIAPVRPPRPEPHANEINDPEEITVGMVVYVASRKYKMAEQFKPTLGHVTKTPYSDQNGSLVIEVEFPNGTEVLRLYDYGIVEYRGGGWSQEYYLACDTPPAATQHVA
jgi:hypothetical protein